MKKGLQTVAHDPVLPRAGMVMTLRKPLHHSLLYILIGHESRLGLTGGRDGDCYSSVPRLLEGRPGDIARTPLVNCNPNDDIDCKVVADTSVRSEER